MPISGGGSGGGGGSGFSLGPAQNTFGTTSTATRAAAETLRNAYATANATWLAEYDGDRSYWIQLVWTGNASVIQRRNAAGDDWEDVTPVIRGPAGPTGAGGADGTDGSDSTDGSPGAAGSAGADGTDGTPGAAGADGADGLGVPAGGTTAQQLAKSSDADNDTEWVDPATGGGGGGSSTFLDLTDTPAAFGTTNQVPAVNAAGDALEFVNQTGAGGTSQTLSRFGAHTTANTTAQALSTAYADILEIAATDIFANVGAFTVATVSNIIYHHHSKQRAV